LPRNRLTKQVKALEWNFEYHLVIMNDPIIVFVFDVKGQMTDISLKGAKFSKIKINILQR
jgi:hypothetical protein